MPKPCEKACRWDFTDRNQTTIKCHECDQREVLRPLVRNETLRALVHAGTWAGPELNLPGGKVDTAQQAQAEPLSTQHGGHVALARPIHTAGSDLVTYETFDGQQVDLSIKMFQQMLCHQANEMQAQYALGWCQHNKIDPFAMEAHFSVMDGKLVIQVSKDAWFKRVENNPRFIAHDGGIIVETALQTIKESILGGMDDYLIAEILKQKLLADFVEGRALEPKGVSPRMTVKKRGIFLGKGEELIGGWAEIRVKDRPHPYRFEIDKEGWQTTTKSEGENVFWRRKGPFMAYKSALKNCCRLAFPDLSGLMNQPEQPDDFDPAAVADFELEQRHLLRQLYAVGAAIQPPIGPLKYPELHTLCVANFEGKGISELSPPEMRNFIRTIELASQGDGEALRGIQEDLGHGRITEIDGATVLGESGSDDYQPTA